MNLAPILDSAQAPAAHEIVHGMYGKQRDCAAEHPELVAELTRLHEAWAQSLPPTK